MKPEIRDYLDDVNRHLPAHVDKERVRAELYSHVYETAIGLEAEGCSEAEAVQTALDNMGDPRQVACGYRSARPFSASGIIRLLLVGNALLFIAGAAIVFAAKTGSENQFGPLFDVFAAHKEWTLFGYSLGWMIAGCLIGYRYGIQAEQRIRYIARFPLMLNYLFMLLVLYRIIPATYFSPMLSSPFIMVCILTTFMFGWFTRVGCRWGRYIHRKSM